MGHLKIDGNWGVITMEKNQKELQDKCILDCCSCEPEDTIAEISEMDWEEKKEYLEYLLRTRSFGC